MQKALNIQKETERLREEVTCCFRSILPARDFSTRLVLAVIRLHWIARNIENTECLNERRKHLKEFLRVKSVIEYWIEALKLKMMTGKETLKKSA